MGKHAELLREGTDRVYAVGAGWWDQRNDECHLGKSRQRSRRDDLSARPRMVIASIVSNTADSGNIVARSPRGKYGRA